MSTHALYAINHVDKLLYIFLYMDIGILESVKHHVLTPCHYK